MYLNMHRALIGNWRAHIRTEPLNRVSDEPDSDFCLLFDLLRLVKDKHGNQKQEEFIGWGNPTLIAQYRNQDALKGFIDCTFAIVPRGFEQMLILQVYDAAHDIYVPLVYILLQGKSKESYTTALGCLLWAFDRRLFTSLSPATLSLPS